MTCPRPKREEKGPMFKVRSSRLLVLCSKPLFQASFFRKETTDGSENLLSLEENVKIQIVMSEGEMYHEVFLWVETSDFFFPFFRIFFVEGNLTEWNPDKITSARQAQMREWSSSLLLITVLWTTTKIKLLHENTEYRQDNLLVYGITSKIMPRIMQVPWYTMDEGKSQVNKGSLVRWWRGQRDLHFSEETAPGSSASFKERMKFTQWLHLGDVRKWILFCPLCYQPLNGWKDPFLSTEPCLHISLRSPKFHALPVLKNATLTVMPWSALPVPPPPPCP